MKVLGVQTAYSPREEIVIEFESDDNEKHRIEIGHSTKEGLGIEYCVRLDNQLLVHLPDGGTPDDMLDHYASRLKADMYYAKKQMTEILLREIIPDVEYLRDEYGLENKSLMHQGFLMGVKHCIKLSEQAIDGIRMALYRGESLKLQDEEDEEEDAQ